MAIFSMNISNVSRASGSTSCATLSYISAEKIFDRRIGKTFNYGRGERVLAVETVLPANAPSEFRNAEELFNSIELHETKANARTAKKIMVALPRELSLTTNQTLLKAFIEENITSRNYACTYAIHSDQEENNPHAHVLIANRQINEKGEWSSKRKMEYVLDENGERIPLMDKNTGQQKVDKNNRKQWKRVSVEQNLLDKKETLQEFRSNWAEVVNRYLEEEQHIDHRSYEEQGVDLLPTKHEGYAARNIEKRGGVSEICERNRVMRLINNALKEIAERIDALTKEFNKLLQKPSMDRDPFCWRDKFNIVLYEDLNELVLFDDDDPEYFYDETIAYQDLRCNKPRCVNKLRFADKENPPSAEEVIELLQDIYKHYGSELDITDYKDFTILVDLDDFEKLKGAEKYMPNLLESKLMHEMKEFELHNSVDAWYKKHGYTRAREGLLQSKRTPSKHKQRDDEWEL